MMTKNQMVLGQKHVQIEMASKDCMSLGEK
jgi:hypothetical protein